LLRVFSVATSQVYYYFWWQAWLIPRHLCDVRLAQRYEHEVIKAVDTLQTRWNNIEDTWSRLLGAYKASVRLRWGSICLIPDSDKLLTVEMSPPLHWTPAEEKALVDFLHENWSEAGDGGNFKKASFQRAIQHIAHHCTNDRPKDIKSCQNKWATVSTQSLIYSVSTDYHGFSSIKSTAPLLLSRQSVDGTGMIKPVPLSCLKLHCLGMTMSRNIPRPSCLGIKAGSICTNSPTLCLLVHLIMSHSCHYIHISGLGETDHAQEGLQTCNPNLCPC
jgi:hypothetical protein